jgi:hypothetical protein
MTAFNRPLTDQERSLLMALATRSLADQFPCSHDEAADVLEYRAAQGQLEIVGNAETANVYVCGNLLVETQRDWLAFHAAHPGNDPMKDQR